MSRSRTFSATWLRLRARAVRSRLRRARCSAVVRLEPVQPVLEEAQDHVHVPPRADRPGELPQHLERAWRTAPAVPLAGEQRQRHPQAAARHPDLVDGLVVAGHGPGQLAEDAGHPVLEQPGRAIVAGHRGVVTVSSPGGRNLPRAGSRPPGRH